MVQQHGVASLLVRPHALSLRPERVAAFLQFIESEGQVEGAGVISTGGVLNYPAELDQARHDGSGRRGRGSRDFITELAGDYGKKWWRLNPGDQVRVRVWNPQTGVGRVEYYLKVSPSVNPNRR